MAYFQGNGTNLTDLDASKVTIGTLGAARIPTLDASKVTTGTLDAARIPELNASKVTTGILDTARIPTLHASKVTGISGGSVIVDGGTIPEHFYGLDIRQYADQFSLGSETMAFTIYDNAAKKVQFLLGENKLYVIGNLQASENIYGDGASINNLNASKVTTGTLDAARIPTLDASKVTTGTLSASVIPSLDITKISQARTLLPLIKTLEYMNPNLLSMLISLPGTSLVSGGGGSKHTFSKTLTFYSPIVYFYIGSGEWTGNEGVYCFGKIFLSDTSTLNKAIVSNSFQIYTAAGTGGTYHNTTGISVSVTNGIATIDITIETLPAGWTLYSYFCPM